MVAGIPEDRGVTHCVVLVKVFEIKLMRLKVCNEEKRMVEGKEEKEREKRKREREKKQWSLV